MNRTMKLLTATTALVAGASAANAETFSSVITTGYNTGASSSAVVSFTSAGGISVTTGPALTISGSGAGTVNLVNGSVIRSTDSTNPAITLGQSSTLTGLTVNNSGTITVTGPSGQAIAVSNTVGGTAQTL